MNIYIALLFEVTQSNVPDEEEQKEEKQKKEDQKDCGNINIMLLSSL